MALASDKSTRHPWTVAWTVAEMAACGRSVGGALVRVLLLGASGMLGHRLALELASRPDLWVVATVRREVAGPFRAPGVSYRSGIALAMGGVGTVLGPLLEEIRPDVIVNAVGAIKQKDLEAAPEEAYFLNGALPHLLAALNPQPGARVIHVSTDCVFRGTRGGYRETDLPDVEDVYGRSKAVGELNYGRHVTLRTSIIGFEIGAQLGLIGWFFRQPRGSRLRGYTRAVYSGLPTATLSRLIGDCATGERDLAGLWHVASEPINKYELLSRINQRFDLRHVLEPDETVCIDRSLNDDRFRSRTGTARPSWDELLDDLAGDWARWPYADVYELLRERR